MVRTQPTSNTDAPRSAATSGSSLLSERGPVSDRSGNLLIRGQAIWWPFDQQKNLATAQNDIFNAGSVIYFCGFCVLMFRPHRCPRKAGAQGWAAGYVRFLCRRPGHDVSGFKRWSS
jgi:hypothetical protein